jgi:hypothetical protein
MSHARITPVLSARPYRFGILYGTLNAIAGLYYGWLAVTSGSVPGTIFLGLSALLAIATGIGPTQAKKRLEWATRPTIWYIFRMCGEA